MYKTKIVGVRLDPVSEKQLEYLCRGGKTKSEVIRLLISEAAKQQQQTK